jgi:hypothetical protein
MGADHDIPLDSIDVGEGEESSDEDDSEEDEDAMKE